MSGPQEALKGLAVHYIIRGTQKAVVKNPHAKSGDQETIDAKKADIKSKSLANGMIGGMKTAPYNVLRNHLEDAEPVTRTLLVTAADPIAHNGMSKGTLMPIQDKRHAGKTDIKGKNVTKGIATITPTRNAGMIAGTARKGYHSHRAMMRTEAMRKQCRSTACLRKLRVTCNVVTPD